MRVKEPTDDTSLSVCLVPGRCIGSTRVLTSLGAVPKKNDKALGDILHQLTNALITLFVSMSIDVIHLTYESALY